MFDDLLSAARLLEKISMQCFCWSIKLLLLSMTQTRRFRPRPSHSSATSCIIMQAGLLNKVTDGFSWYFWMIAIDFGTRNKQSGFGVSVYFTPFNNSSVLPTSTLSVGVPGIHRIHRSHQYLITLMALVSTGFRLSPTLKQSNMTILNSTGFRF